MYELKTLAGLDDRAFAQLILIGHVEQETKDTICQYFGMTEDEVICFPLKMMRVKTLKKIREETSATFKGRSRSNYFEPINLGRFTVKVRKPKRRPLVLSLSKP
jgi:hypothetical protein